MCASPWSPSWFLPTLRALKTGLKTCSPVCGCLRGASASPSSLAPSGPMWLWNMDTDVTPLQNTHPPSGPTRGASTLASAAAPEGPMSQKFRLSSCIAVLHTHAPSDRVGVDAGAVDRIHSSWSNPLWPDTSDASSAPSVTHRGARASKSATAPSSPMELNSRFSDRSTLLNTHVPSAFRLPCSADARNLAPSGPMDAFARFRPVTRVLKFQFRIGLSTGMSTSESRCLRLGARRRTIFGGGVSPSPSSLARSGLVPPAGAGVPALIVRPFIVSHCCRSAFMVSLSPSRRASRWRLRSSSASLSLASSTCDGPSSSTDAVSMHCRGGDFFLALMTIGELG